MKLLPSVRRLGPALLQRTIRARRTRQASAVAARCPCGLFPCLIVRSNCPCRPLRLCRSRMNQPRSQAPFHWVARVGTDPNSGFGFGCSYNVLRAPSGLHDLSCLKCGTCKRRLISRQFSNSRPRLRGDRSGLCGSTLERGASFNHAYRQDDLAFFHFRIGKPAFQELQCRGSDLVHGLPERGEIGECPA